MSTRRGLLLAAPVYLLLAVLLWWHAWGGGAASTLATGSLDPGQNVWWLAWMPHALSTGANPLFTRDMFWPAGVNVVANTSFLLVGLVLSPVTVVFGPVAAFTVAVTLAPAADALAAFAALRRHVSWTPAAFAGGLLYGFGPFVGTDLRYGHLNLTVLLFPPLLLLLLERILFGHPGRRVAVAGMLAVLLVAEFFVSTEMLALGVVTAAIATAVVAVGARRRVGARLPDVSWSIGGGVLLSAAALAYPVWWYLAGPRHFTGAVWRDMARFSATLASFVQPHGELLGTGFLSGGNGDYLGVGLLVVLVGGALAWRRDRVLRFALGMALVTAVLSLGPSLHVRSGDTGVPLPAWPLLHLPLVDSVAPSRFGAFTDLFCALALAVVLDRLHGATIRRRPEGRKAAVRIAAVTGPTAVAAAALVPLALAQGWPYAVGSLHQPAVVAALARLPERSVVREFPLVSGTDARGLVWQATAGLRYEATGGYAIAPGSGGRAAIQPPDDALGLVFAGIALGKIHAPYSASLLEDVRVHAWDHDVVATAVVAGTAHAGEVAGLLEEALGPATVRDRSGWLWRAPAR